MNMPVWCSRYATQLQRWVDCFSSESVLVLDQSDLLSNRVATIQRACAFLGVDAAYSSPQWESVHNAASAHRRPRPLARHLGLQPSRLGPLGRMFSYEIPAPRLTEAQRQRVERILIPEAQRLREMTGMAFADWSI